MRGSQVVAMQRLHGGVRNSTFDRRREDLSGRTARLTSQ